MPFADGGGMVAQGLKQFGDGHFIRMETMFGGMVERTVNAHPIGVTPRKQGGTGSGANGLCGMEIGKPHPLRSHLIQVGRPDIGRSEYADILVTLIVGKDDDDIGFLPLSLFLRTGINEHQASRG